MDEIMSTPNIEQIWNSDEIKHLMLSKIKAYLHV